MYFCLTSDFPHKKPNRFSIAPHIVKWPEPGEKLQPEARRCNPRMSMVMMLLSHTVSVALYMKKMLSHGRDSLFNGAAVRIATLDSFVHLPGHQMAGDEHFILPKRYYHLPMHLYYSDE